MIAVKSYLLSLTMNIVHLVGTFFALRVYNGIPITSASVCADVNAIFDFAVNPISLDVNTRYDNRWDFPTDYVLKKTYPDDTPMAIATDDKGTIKIYEYDETEQRLMISDGWGATITPEGSVIYHGPRCDTRGEICILVPFGYSLEGTSVGETLDVIETIWFGSASWVRDTAFDRQVYNILYNTEAEPKLITQEVTWDTDTLFPVVKTVYHDEQFNRYDIKWCYKRNLRKDLWSKRLF